MVVYERREMRKRYLLVACTSSAALNLSNREEVAVRPRDARLVQVPHVRLGVVRDSAACQDRVRQTALVGRPNQFIDTSETCFQFGVLNNTATDAFLLDGSAYSFINRLNVLSAGQVQGRGSGNGRVRTRQPEPSTGARLPAASFLVVALWLPASRTALSAAVGGWAEPLLGSAAALAATPLPPRCTLASSPRRIRRAATARLSLELHSVPTA